MQRDDRVALGIVVRWTGLVFLPVRHRVVLVKVETLDRILQDLDYLLTGVLFVRWAVGPRLELFVVNLLVHLS